MQNPEYSFKKRITQCFNKGASTYDSASKVQSIVAQRLVQRLFSLNAQHILEIGCGTGELSQQLFSQFPSAKFVISDIAPEMVTICQKRFATFTNVKTLVMDGEVLIDDSFDLITSSMALHWFVDIRQSFAKIISNLTHNGHFIFAMLGENSLQEWRDICNRRQIPNAMPSFPSWQMLKKNFPSMEIDTEVIHASYQNTYEFLQSLKKIGAVAAHQKYVPIPTGTLRRILRQSENDINISYEIIYGHYIKS